MPSPLYDPTASLEELAWQYTDGRLWRGAFIPHPNATAGLLLVQVAPFEESQLIVCFDKSAHDLDDLILNIKTSHVLERLAESPVVGGQVPWTIFSQQETPRTVSELCLSVARLRAGKPLSERYQSSSLSMRWGF